MYSHPLSFKARKNPEDLIAVGGATLMDTTLGLFSVTLGTEYAINSTINGIIFSVMAPFIVPFLRPFESVSSSNYQIPELIKPILLFA
ncbi:MAG: LysO family transporter [Nitrososphaeria archaeon]